MPPALPTQPIEDRQAAARPPLDRAAILATIYQRQALRREAKLKLLDIRAEYERAVDHALWTAHVAEHGERVREDVLAELRARHGQQFGGSVGGLIVLRLMTSKRLTEMFEDGR